VLEDLDAVQVEVAPAVPDHHRHSNSGGNSNNNNPDHVEVTYRGKRRITLPLTFCGVFDGHGGDHASQFCSDWMSSYLRNDENYPYDLGLAMKNAFNHVDDDFVATGQPDGTTACCVTLVGGRRIVCANAGDSRAIVVRRDGSIVRLSRDHKPGMPDETRRISELGGRVIYWGRWRVEGLLAVSRSIGDASLKPFITAEPEICEYDVGKDDLFLIVSSDGIWDVMDNDEVAHVVLSSSCAIDNGRLVIDTARFKTAAKNLCQHAKASGSADNFAVIVVDLKSCGNPSSASGRYDPCS
jgi:protein phosphatase 1L